MDVFGTQLICTIKYISFASQYCAFPNKMCPISSRHTPPPSSSSSSSPYPAANGNPLQSRNNHAHILARQFMHHNDRVPPIFRSIRLITRLCGHSMTPIESKNPSLGR
eukprot:793713_1